jgi:outer membrane lipoprotein SlyB
MSLLPMGCQTQPGLGTVGGAGAGVAVGSMVGSGRGRTAAMIGGGLLGAAAGNQLVDRPVADANAARREAERDAEWQRRLDFERQVIIERDRAQREIEERRLFEEWKRTRGA